MVTHDDESRRIILYRWTVQSTDNILIIKIWEWTFESISLCWRNDQIIEEKPSNKLAKKPKSALIVPGASISKKEPSKKSDKKPKGLYIVPGAPTLLYQQGNPNSCILFSLGSKLHHMGDGYASEYIIRRKQRSLFGN